MPRERAQPLDQLSLREILEIHISDDRVARLGELTTIDAEGVTDEIATWLIRQQAEWAKHPVHEVPRRSQVHGSRRRRAPGPRDRTVTMAVRTRWSGSSSKTSTADAVHTHTGLSELDGQYLPDHDHAGLRGPVRGLAESGTSPEIDAMLTIEPWPADCMIRPAAWQAANVPYRPTATPFAAVWSNSAEASVNDRTYGNPKKFRAGIPMRRIAKPTDVAASISFLLSAESGFTTGQALVIDGGESVL